MKNLEKMIRERAAKKSQEFISKHSNTKLGDIKDEESIFLEAEREILLETVQYLLDKTQSDDGWKKDVYGTFTSKKQVDFC